MTYSVVDFSKSLRIDACRIRFTPNLIFLCGGPQADSGSFRSARDYFFRLLKADQPDLVSRVKLAEEINKWFHRSPFPDLLELENYLADLADLIILFVESPGSIAELGAFAASNELRPKTLAVLSTTFGNGSSFITDGPVRKIQNEAADLVHYYEWDPNDPNSTLSLSELEAMSKDVLAFLEARAAKHVKEPVLDLSKKPGHVLLWIADLIRVAGIATSRDIAECLNQVGLDGTTNQVERYLSLLQSLGFVEQRPASNHLYYLSTSTTAFIRYGYKAEAPYKDLARVQTAIRAGHDSTRTRVLRAAIKRGFSHV